MEKQNLQKTWRGMPADDKAEMAEALCTTVNYLAQVCNGHKDSSKSIQVRIARHLGVDSFDKLDLSCTNRKNTKAA